MASPLAEQEGAPRHVGPVRNTGQRLGCGPSEADLCDRKGKPAFASETGLTDFTQFSPPLKAELSAPCHDVLWRIVLPFLSGSLPLGPASLTKADGQLSTQHRREEPILISTALCANVGFARPVKRLRRSVSRSRDERRAQLLRASRFSRQSSRPRPSNLRSRRKKPHQISRTMPRSGLIPIWQ